MATPIKMPTLGLTMESGVITRWLKKVGDPVNKDEPLFTVETDKAENEVESPVSGVLLQIVVPEGQEVPVQQVIAYVGQPGEMPAAPGPSVGPRAPGQEAAAPAPIAVGPNGGAAPGTTRELRASPLARRVARELGVDLAQVKGSGPEGRIQEADVRAFAAARQQQAAAVAAAPSLAAPAAPPAPTPVAAEAAAPAPGAAGRVEPLNRIRRVTAERMAQSARSVARVTLFAETDFDEAVRFRKHLKDEFEKRYGVKLSYDAMLVKACASALREFPIMNAQWADNAVRYLPEVHVGVAVAVEAGLLVAVVRDADRKSLVEIARDIDAMAARAREGKLGVAEMAGSTFTITNLGGYGVDAFTPIVNPPEAAILGVGRIAQRPVVVDGRLEARHTCWLSLSFDHRIVDGAPAGDFLSRVAEIIAKPYLLVGTLALVARWGRGEALPLAPRVDMPRERRAAGAATVTR